MWRQQMILPFKDGKDFAEKMMASAPRLANALAQAEPEDQAHFQRLVEKMAARILDSEQPIGLEVLLVIAQKPVEEVEGEPPAEVEQDGDLGFGRDEAVEPEEVSADPAEVGATDVPPADSNGPEEILPAEDLDLVAEEPQESREETARNGEDPDAAV